MTINTRRIGAIAAAATMLSVSAPVLADAPTFQVDPTALGARHDFDTFTTNQLNVTSSTLLTTTGNTHSGAGWMTFGSYSLAGSTLDAGDTGLGITYRLYATFELTDTYRAGTGLVGQQHINGAGTFNDLTSLTFKLYADPTRNTLFTTKANASTGTAAAVTGVTNDDILLGVGSLLTGISSFNEKGGAGINASLSFALCSGAGTASYGGAAATGALAALAVGCTTDTGENFFSTPDPFFNTVFAALNNTQQGVVAKGNLLSLNNAAGNIDFNTSPVPEPSTYAMLGLGLAVLAGVARRRKA